jgi:hypothetical protein
MAGETVDLRDDVRIQSKISRVFKARIECQFQLLSANVGCVLPLPLGLRRPFDIDAFARNEARIWIGDSAFIMSSAENWNITFKIGSELALESVSDGINNDTIDKVAHV